MNFETVCIFGLLSSFPIEWYIETLILVALSEFSDSPFYRNFGDGQLWIEIATSASIQISIFMAPLDSPLLGL